MSNTPTITTRFAPSPTGFLHIGGARTALFNWLYARGRNGRFLLRIEDTDRERSTPEAEAAILSGLDWLGLDWDEEPVSQFARADRHRAIAQHLLDEGKAYRCYLAGEALETARAAARDAGHALRSPWRERDPGDAPADTPFVIRFKGPLDGAVHLADVIQGDVTIPAKTLDDLVIVRSDGAPTYNLAVVVDDHDMQVTHVVRGDDHLVNAARQSLIYDALGWPAPVFAHMPLIHGADGKKLSKRHGALGVEEYRAMGYLPAGLRNYLLRLGWSHGDQELFTDAQARTLFDLDAINKGPARLDFDKLASVNAHHMAQTDTPVLMEPLLAQLSHTGQLAGAPDPELHARITRGVDVLKLRAKTVVDLADQLAFATTQRPIEPNAKAAKALTPEAIERISHVRSVLGDFGPWTQEALGKALQAIADDLQVGFGKIGAPARAALTGGLPAPDLSQTLYVLGPVEAMSRLDDVLTGATA